LPAKRSDAGWPWAGHYNMADYVTEELPELIAAGRGFSAIRWGPRRADSRAS
jgi:S-formylglutathione hydrolase FrmB